MKKGNSIAAMLILVMLLSGWVRMHSDHTEAEQAAYLTRSLGPYTAERERVSKGHSPIPAVDRGYEWAAQYTDAKGASRIFRFNNIEAFGGQVCHIFNHLRKKNYGKNLSIHISCMKNKRTSFPVSVRTWTTMRTLIF